jgi:hypothetical protein
VPEHGADEHTRGEENEAVPRESESLQVFDLVNGHDETRGCVSLVGPQHLRIRTPDTNYFL